MSKEIVSTITFVAIVFAFVFNSCAFIFFVLALYFLVLVKYRENLPVFLLLVYLTSHLFLSTPFFFSGKFISFWADFQTEYYIRKVFFIDSLFIYTLSMILSSSKTKFSPRPELLSQISVPSTFFFFLFSFVILLFTKYGLDNSSLLNGQSYGFHAKNSLNEYSIILFLMLSVTICKKSLLQKVFFNALIFYFIVKNILFGGRIEVFQLVLLLSYIYLVIPGKVNLWSFLMLGLPVLVVFLVVGFVRSNPLLIFDADFVSLLYSNFTSILKDVEYYNSTQGDVVQSSARILGIVETGELQFWQRLFSFPIYLISSMVPPSFLPDYANLSVFKQERFQSGGGGLAPVYFFVWLGYIGPVLLGFWIGKIINIFGKTRNKSFFIYSLLVLVTFPRWYSYNPVFLVKFCFYGSIIYLILSILSKSLTESRTQK